MFGSPPAGPVRIGGDATPEEVAAVLAVLLRAGGAADEPPPTRSFWRDSGRPGAVRAGWRHG